MEKGKKLYEGKAKIIYATKDKTKVIQHFKDDATAFNNRKKAIIRRLNGEIEQVTLSSNNNSTILIQPGDSVEVP